MGIVCRLDDVACNSLLEHLAQWLLKLSVRKKAAVSDRAAASDSATGTHAAISGVSAGSAMWAYALLARLDTPVVTSTLAAIRDLATACHGLGGAEAALLVDICSRAFGQQPRT
jgi:hypothetical protein